MKVSIIGAGVAGTATGVGLIRHGHDVVFYDIDKDKIELLKKDGYNATLSIEDSFCETQVAFICVPTPTKNGNVVYSYLESAIVQTAKALKKNDCYCVIVVKSTVLPHTTRDFVQPLLVQHSGLTLGADFGLCMNPEFLRQNHALHDFLNPSRIVIGEYDSRSGDVLECLYEKFECPIFRTEFEEAEMIKYVANIFLACKISFFNEIFLVSQKIGVDAEKVSKIVALDTRIGEYGVYGGRAFEGSCLPKDLDAFLEFKKQFGIQTQLLEEVRNVNFEMKKGVNIKN